MDSKTFYLILITNTLAMLCAAFCFVNAEGWWRLLALLPLNVVLVPWKGSDE